MPRAVGPHEEFEIDKEYLARASACTVNSVTKNHGLRFHQTGVNWKTDNQSLIMTVPRPEG